MSWGYKMMFTFIAFALMMCYLVYRCLGTNFELVNKDYYKDELRYQQVIDGANRANLLGTGVTVTQTESRIILQMPEEIKNKNISGSVFFYCAYDSKKDRKFKLNVNNEGQDFFSTERIHKGDYTVKIDWTMDGKNFYSEKHITVR